MRPITVMIVLSGLAIVECEVPGFRSAISLVDALKRSFSSKSIRADVSIRGDVVIVRGAA